MKLGRADTTTAAHPDHFDPTKYGRNGQRLDLKRGVVGKRSNIRPDDVEQVLFLERLAKAAANDLAEYLEARGLKTKQQRTEVLKRLRNGWRPLK